MLYMMISDSKINLIKSVYAVGYGGVMEAVCKMAMGNKLGFEFTECCDKSELFKALYGSVIIEVDGLKANGSLGGMLETVKLGHTTDDGVIKIENESISIDEIVSAWQKPL